jgi:hypothetical protein
MGRFSNGFSRRKLLRGAGTVAIALPFLPALSGRGARAALPDPPVRAFNLFHGLGFPTPLQGEGFEGPLAPLSVVGDKLAILRGVNQRRCDEGGINAHFDGASGAFTATPPDGEARAGGPSIDQVLRRATGSTSPTVLAGTYFRRSRPVRYVHSWNDDGTAAGVMQEAPDRLFSRIFGSDPSMVDPSMDPAMQRATRLRRSVLDSVVDQYTFYQSAASPLGAAAKATLSNHLEKIREYETRAFGMGMEPSCTVPGAPGGSTIPHGAGADPDGTGIDITVDALTAEFRLLSDIYALGIQCDAFRFGCLTFQAAGERIRLRGAYDYDGGRFYDFDDAGERAGQTGDQACSHEWWHEFNPSADNSPLRAHIHLMMRELAYFLSQLADPAYSDENGLTILENSMVTISTESGDGRHNDVPRELSGVFHAISGANERFRTGAVIDLGDVEGKDVYNTMLEAMGVGERVGGDGFNRIDAILR